MIEPTGDQTVLDGNETPTAEASRGLVSRNEFDKKPPAELAVEHRAETRIEPHAELAVERHAETRVESRIVFGRGVPATITPTQIAAMIDHALLKPELTPAEVRLGCQAAAALGVWSVCVKPADVQLAMEAVAATSTKVCAVISFPHGNSASSIKVAETEQALADGAREIDLVPNVGRLRADESGYVRDEIRGVVEVAHAANSLVKVIFENAYLTDDEIARASRLAEEAGADFIKTSTGFASAGATLHDVRIMAQSASPAVQVKASGGIRTLDRALEFIALGVTRLGVSASQEILAEAILRLNEFGVIEVPDVAAHPQLSPIPEVSSDQY